MIEFVLCSFRNINIQNKAYTTIVKNKQLLLSGSLFSFVPSRTTIIVRRPYPPNLFKEGNNVRFRKRSQFYEFVEDTNNRRDPLIDVVLTSYVQGVGNPGDIVSMKMSAAYNKLLVLGLGDYASPQMVEYSKKLKEDAQYQDRHIPVSIDSCIKYLQGGKILVTMNQRNKWTIEPWHIRANARKRGFQFLSDDCIELPTKPIHGPDMALEGKEFLVTITINGKYKAKVRCYIHHWTSDAAEYLPLPPEWYLAPSDWLFPEHEEEFKEIVSPEQT